MTVSQRWSPPAARAAARLPRAAGGRRRAAVRRRRRGHLRGARRAGRGVRLPARPVPHRCAASSTAATSAGRTRSARRPAPRRASASARCPAGCCPPGWSTRCGPATWSRCCRRRARSPPTSASAGHHVLIAAGSGITPVLSIAASLLREPAAHASRVLYGNRRSGTVMFADELADLKDAHPARLELVHVLSREPREAELFSGRLDAARLTHAAAAADRRRRRRPLVAVRPVRDGHRRARGARRARRAARAGPPGAVLRRRGAAGAGAPRDAADGRRARPARSRSCSTAGPRPWSSRRDVPVLDAAQRVRPDLPFACKGGVCGTCRARLVDGRGHDAAQLRPRAGRARRRFRPHLPVDPRHRRDHRRLRRWLSAPRRRSSASSGRT